MKNKIIASLIICISALSCLSFSVATINDEEKDLKVWNPIDNEVKSENVLETGLVPADLENESENTIETSTNQVFNTSSILVSNNALTTNSETRDDNPLKLTSGGAILIEQNSGTVLYDHNMHEKLRPASVTKVMTILLIMEALDSGKISLTDKVPCTEDAAAMRWLSDMA